MIVLDVWGSNHIIEDIHNKYDNVFFMMSSNMKNVCVCWNNDEIVTQDQLQAQKKSREIIHE